MSNTNETIEALLSVIQKHAASVEAIQRIAELRTSAAKMAEENSMLRDTANELRGKLDKAIADLTSMQNAAASVAAREKAVAAAELKNAVDAKTLELTQQSKSEFKELLHLALRSPIVRTTQSELIPVNTQYGVQTHTATTTTESQAV